MGNQSIKVKGNEGDISTPPPRPKKPAHLQRPRIDTLPVDPTDPRAFNLPLQGSLLHYGSPQDSVPAPSYFSNTSAGVYETVDRTDIQSDSTPIGELVEEYGAQLPLRFSVSESLYGVCEESSLMEGQLLNVHFEKETKVVRVQANTGAEYMVPLNSSLIFSILYNPHNKMESAKRGYMFPKVFDLINASSVPQAVVVTTAFQYSHENGDILLVMEGQTLIINSVQCSDDGTKRLKCTMVNRNIILFLDENIVGNFSTCSSMLKFRLSEIIELISLPISVVLENSGDKRLQLPLHATVSTYTILDQGVEKSVIVSSKYNNQENQLIEILLSVPIDVHLIKMSQQQTQLLRTESQSVYETFHPSKLSKVVIDSNSSMNYIQSMLFKVVPEDDTWKLGIDLYPPQPPSTSFRICTEEEDYLEMSMDNVVDSQVPQPVISTHPSYITTSSTSAPSTPSLALKSNRVEPPTTAIKSRPPPPIPQSHSSHVLSQEGTPTHSDSFRSLPRQKKHNTVNTPAAAAVADPVPYMIVRDVGGGTLAHEEPYEYVKLSYERRIELDLLRKKLTELENTNTQLESHIKELNKEPQAASSTTALYDTTVTEANRNLISSYSCEQILEVLDKINLSQYKESFQTEGINGCLFIDLDEEILEMELNVKSKIHRIRIMRLVTGKQSVKDL